VVVIVVCLASAGCGSGQVREIHAWRSDAPYIPPPDPGNGQLGVAEPEIQKAKSSHSGAPSDAEVARELEKASGTRPRAPSTPPD
jgi:hypothetical protein